MSDQKVDKSVEESQKGADKRRAKGEFVRGLSGFRSRLGDADFPPEPGRYHLFVALNCPWCHRVTLARNMLGLQDVVSMDVAFPNRTGEGDPDGPNLWQFAPDRISTLTGEPLPECTEETGTGQGHRLVKHLDNLICINPIRCSPCPFKSNNSASLTSNSQHNNQSC